MKVVCWREFNKAGDIEGLARCVIATFGGRMQVLAERAPLVKTDNGVGVLSTHR